MAHRTPAPLRAATSLLRALFGLTVLTALVIGAPYLLLLVGHQPTDLPGRGLEMLMRDDDGTLLLTVITCIGWAAWAAFTLSALIEVTAVARRRSTPRIKGLGGLQSLSGFLIGGIVLLAPTAAAAATPSQAIAATAPQTATEATPSPTTTAATPSAETPNSPPQHTVTSPRETLWDLAEDRLGSGPRWKDIAALNPEHPELATGDAQLRQGMTLKLPADARPSSTASHTEDAPTASPTPENQPDPTAAQETPAASDGTSTVRDDEQPKNVTVEKGDTLWTIADDLGDPADWTQIFEENKGAPQPGGGRFTDPDLVFPGQQLDIPQATAQPPKKPTSPSNNDKPSTEADQPPKEHQNTDEKTEKPTPPPVANTPAPQPTQETKPQQSNQSPAQDRDNSLAPTAAWTGAGVLATALISTLTTRRILQQRRRRPGRRITMPQGRAAATEQSLRSVQALTGFDLLKTSLRTLALNLTDAGRNLPDLHAVVLHETRIDLHLAEAEDAPPCAPFAATDQPHVWTCTASSPLADPETLKGADAPYPALVSLGWDSHGNLVLIDLEHVGILNLTGDEALTRHVLQAIAVELANTTLPSHLEVTTVTGTAPGLADAVPERVRAGAFTDATNDLAAHTTSQRRALKRVGANSPRAARLRDDTDEWTPHVLLAQRLQERDATFLELLTEQPRTASAVITTTPAAPPHDKAWNLTCQGPDETVALPGSGIPIRLQGLSDAHFADAVEILAIADSQTDAPPSNWTHLAPEDHEDGLPAEYAQLEPDLNEGEAEHPSSAATPIIPAPHDPQGTDPLPEGPSLAEVLAEDDSPRTAASPCAVQTPPAVHATIPETSPPAPTPGPAILLLGPVAVEGATGRVQSGRKRASTELAAFLALNPRVDHHAIDDALWPGQKVTKEMRNATISRLRSWLDKAPDGTAYLPRIQDTSDNRYRLVGVTCDWTQFQHHARTGLTDHTEDGDLALRRALTLVRGRPFAAIDPQRYAWAEPATQEMVSAIVDVAHTLSTRCRETGDIPGALWAARRGLLASEESELLHRALFLAHHAAGDTTALREAAASLARINEELGSIDMEQETAELLRTLLPRPPYVPTSRGGAGDGV